MSKQDKQDEPVLIVNAGVAGSHGGAPPAGGTEPEPEPVPGWDQQFQTALNADQEDKD